MVSNQKSSKLRPLIDAIARCIVAEAIKRVKATKILPRKIVA
jgi:hypothetical protein